MASATPAAPPTPLGLDGGDAPCLLGIVMSSCMRSGHHMLRSGHPGHPLPASNCPRYAAHRTVPLQREMIQLAVAQAEPTPAQQQTATTRKNARRNTRWVSSAEVVP
jgi:hypothetical protein